MNENLRNLLNEYCDNTDCDTASTLLKDFSGDSIQQLRKDVLKISRKEFALIIGLSESTLKNLENSRYLITFQNLISANLNFNFYVESNNLNIVENAFALVMLGAISPNDVFTKEQSIQESVIDFEKEKLFGTYKKLSDTDQKKIFERMEYIISTYEDEDNIPTKRIAVLGQTACGNPIEAISIADEFIETNDLKASFALRAVGDSMSPLINDGDTILIKQTTELEISDIGIFQINQSGFSDEEEVTCKMLKSIKDGVMTLVPLNSAHDPIIVDTKKHQVKIIGKYIGRA